MERRQYLSQSEEHNERMNQVYSNIFKVVGVVLQIVFLGLYSVINYSIIFDIIMLHRLAYNSTLLTVFLYTIYGYCSLNILFNYLAACAISPGQTQDYPELNLEHFSQFLNLNICHKCQKVKPPRSHHCSICRKCVFKMDHHCPWINNCVGHFNMRYFLLFLFYSTWQLFLGSVGFLHINFNSIFDDYLDETTQVAYLVQVLCFALTIALSLFTAINWGLAIRGYTQIEYWNKKIPSPQDLSRQVTFQHSNAIDNLNEVFGTRKVYLMFLPSFRNQPEDGIYWNNCTQNIFQQSLQDITNSNNNAQQNNANSQNQTNFAQSLPINQSNQPNQNNFIINNNLNNQNNKGGQFYQLPSIENDHDQFTDEIA